MGTAGLAIALSQGKFQDSAVNAGGLLVAGLLAALDFKSQNDQVSSARASMENDKLGKGLYSDVPSVENQPESSPIPAPASPPRIQTAAELLRDMP